MVDTLTPPYSREEQAKLDKVAAEAAKREYDSDPNRKDPKGTQDRVEAALQDFRDAAAQREADIREAQRRRR